MTEPADDTGYRARMTLGDICEIATDTDPDGRVIVGILADCGAAHFDLMHQPGDDRAVSRSVLQDLIAAAHEAIDKLGTL